MAGIFISYRREDSGPWAARLYDALVARFGRDRVFFDVDTIPPGRDFRETVQQALASCEALLAVIGNGWASLRDESGGFRLDGQNDYVRIEIATALEKGLHVIPVLVGGAPMPNGDVLPQDLQPLIFRNAMVISDRHFHQDAQVLMNALKGGVGETPSLFPLFGVTPGKTTEIDLARVGRRSVTIDDSTGQPYNHYLFNEVKFWYDQESRTVNQLYFAKGLTGPFPTPWEKLGLRWANSYDEWTSVLKTLGYLVTVQEEPTIKIWENHDSFSARMVARKEEPHPHELRLVFDYSSGISPSAAGTLGSLEVRSMDKDQFTEALSKDREAAASQLPIDDQEAKFTAEDWLRNAFRASSPDRNSRIKRDPEKALRCYNNAIRLNPEFADAYVGRSDIRAETGDIAGAIEDIDQAMRLGSPRDNCYGRRGRFRDKKGDFDGALADYDEAIRLIRSNLPELDLSLWVTLEARAEVRERKGSLAGAEQDYTEMLRMHPNWTNNLEIYQRRARVREGIGNRSGAAQDRQEAERLRIHFMVEENRRKSRKR